MAMVFIFSFLSFAIGYIVRKTVAKKKIISAETYAKNLVENAQKDAEASKKEKVLKMPASGWAPTWPREPRSCMRDSATTTRAHWAARWWRAASARA